MKLDEAKPRERHEILHGLKAIADHLKIRERQAKHWHGQGLIPTFNMGTTICARVGDLDDAMAERVRLAAEAAAAARAKAEAESEAEKAAASPTINDLTRRRPRRR